MTISYLINQTIIFTPKDNSLILRGSLAKPMILNSPTSHCLTMLIQCKGEIISHYDLFYAAWGDAGRNLPTHNIYQHISLLRKALRFMDAGRQDWIVTIPRKGFMLVEELDVILFNDDIISPPPVYAKITVNKPVDSPIHRQCKHSPFRQLISLLLCITFLIVVTALLLTHNSNDASNLRLEDYFYTLKSERGCHYMISSTSEVEKFDVVLPEYIAHQCQRYKWIYISTSRLSADASILACQNSLVSKHPARCVSNQLTNIKIHSELKMKSSK